MKTKEEWFNDWESGRRYMSMSDFVQAIQSDAFHAGKLEGFEKSKEICERLAAELHCTDCQECANEIEACFNYLTNK